MTDFSYLKKALYATLSLLLFCQTTSEARAPFPHEESGREAMGLTHGLKAKIGIENLEKTAKLKDHLGVREAPATSGTSVESVLIGQGDIGQTLEDMVSSQGLRSTAISIASAGVAKELGEYFKVAANPTTIGEHLKSCSVNMTAQMSAEVAFSQSDFGDILQNNLRLGAASLVGGAGSSKIGKAAHSGAIDPITQALCHAAIGGAQAAIMKGDLAMGAMGAVVGEVAGQLYRKGKGEEAFDRNAKDFQDTINTGVDIARFTAATFACLTGGDAEMAAMTAGNAARYNSFAQHATVSAMGGQIARGSLEELEQELEGTEDKEERAVIEQKILRARSRVQYFEEDPARQLSATFSPVNSGVEAFNERNRSEFLARATESIDLALEDHHKGNILSAFGHSQNARGMGLASFFRIANSPAEYLGAGLLVAPAVSRAASSTTQLFKATHKAMRRAAHAGELASSGTKAPLTKLVPLRATAPVTSTEQNFQRALTHAVEESSGLSKASASSRALAEQHVGPKSFISQAEHKMAAAEVSASAARAPVEAQQALREGLRGVPTTRGPPVGAALEGQGLKVKRNTKGFIEGVEGTQIHHIIHKRLSDHELWIRAGRTVEDRANKMLLPTVEGAVKSTTKRSIHQGSHVKEVWGRLREQMDDVITNGTIQNWSQQRYSQELNRIIREEKALLKSGEQALNKHGRKAMAGGV